MQKKQRNSSVELLRIVATLMVVVSHCSFHGFYHTGEGYMWIDSTWNRFLLQISNMGSLGVNVFVLIMGYYMIKSKSGGGRFKANNSFNWRSLDLFINRIRTIYYI